MKKKEYKKKNSENLAHWCERIAAMCCGRSLEDVLDMIIEVSKTSYFEGIETERKMKTRNYD